MTDEQTALNKGQTISGLIWKLMERGGYSVVQMVIQIILARLLTPDDFGALAIMLVFVNIGNVFVQSGLNTALIQAPEQKDSDYSTVFYLSFGMAFILYLVVFFAAPEIANFYFLPNLVWPLRGLALILLINSFNSVQIAKLTRDLQMKKAFAATLASVVISGVVGVALALRSYGLWALVCQQITYQLVNCFVLAFSVSWRPHLEFDVKRAKELYRFGWRLLVSGVLEQGYQSLADLIIGRQFTSAQLGLVSQGKKYPAAIGSMLDGAIQPVMLASVSRVQTDVNKVKRLVRRSLKTSTFLIAPSMTLFACAAPSLVKILLGEKWMSIVPMMQIYCLVYALLPIHTTNLQALNGMGRSDLFLKLEIIKKVYGITILWICAFVFKNIHLLVFSYLVTGVISTFVNSWPNRRVIGYSYGEQVRDIAPAFILSAISAVIAVGINGLILTPILTLTLQIVLFAISYLGLAFFIKLETLTYLIETLRNMMVRAD